MKITLNTISYTTAISLAALSGGVATFEMMKLVPGAEIVVGAMGLLFEAGKLTSFAMLHHRNIPRLLRGALATVGLTLMTANIAGVSGYLSHEYERTHLNAQATSHTAKTSAHAEASLLDRHLAQAERDRLVTKLSAANASTAQVEGNAIASTSEFAAVQFIAGATGASTDSVAHAAILTISAVPDILAVLLLLAAGYSSSRRSSRNLKAKPVRKAKTRTVRKPKLEVVNAHPYLH